MENCARTVRKKERRCTMPSAWKSKTEILVERLKINLFEFVVQ